jgi:hypothetical protein
MHPDPPSHKAHCTGSIIDTLHSLEAVVCRPESRQGQGQYTSGRGSTSLECGRRQGREIEVLVKMVKGSYAYALQTLGCLQSQQLEIKQIVQPLPHHPEASVQGARGRVAVRSCGCADGRSRKIGFSENGQ